jgi:hypothetical protein
MLIARLAPLDSPLFKRLSSRSRSLDRFMAYQPVTWFGIWIVFMAGFSAHRGFIDRHYFWSFDSWLRGGLALMLVTGLTVGFLLKHGRVQYTAERLTKTHLVTHLLLSYVLFLLGWFSHSPADFLTALVRAWPYVGGYLAVILVYAIAIDREQSTDRWSVHSQSQRQLYLALALGLDLFAAGLGYGLDDPVSSTAATVYLPFLLVALVGRHVRHVQRTRIYPVLIWAAFVTSREGWFLFPLLLLFFALRYYHYFRHRIIYPTFAV